MGWTPRVAGRERRPWAPRLRARVRVCTRVCPTMEGEGGGSCGLLESLRWGLSIRRRRELSIRLGNKAVFCRVNAPLPRGKGVSLNEGIYGKRQNENIIPRGDASEGCVRLAGGRLSSMAGEGVFSLTTSAES